MNMSQETLRELDRLLTIVRQAASKMKFSEVPEVQRLIDAYAAYRFEHAQLAVLKARGVVV
jgi:hypothetical protein